MKRLVKCLQFSALVIALSIAMGSWTSAAAQGDGFVDKISAGYKFLRASQGDSDAENFPLGFYFDASGDLAALSGWDWIGEVTYGRKSDSETEGPVSIDFTQNIVLVAGGLKREFTTNPAWTPHLQVLVGFVRHSATFEISGGGFSDEDSESGTDFAFKISGALDKPITDRMDLRGGAGYIRVFAEDEGVNVIRLFAGIVWKLGTP